MVTPFYIALYIFLGIIAVLCVLSWLLYMQDLCSNVKCCGSSGSSERVDLGFELEERQPLTNKDNDTTCKRQSLETTTTPVVQNGAIQLSSENNHKSNVENAEKTLNKAICDALSKRETVETAVVHTQAQSHRASTALTSPPPYNIHEAEVYKAHTLPCRKHQPPKRKAPPPPPPLVNS